MWPCRVANWYSGEHTPPGSLVEPGFLVAEPPTTVAEDYHQQYLSDQKNPNGYCNHGPNGLTCPVGVARTPEGAAH